MAHKGTYKKRNIKGKHSSFYHNTLNYSHLHTANYCGIIRVFRYYTISF